MVWISEVRGRHEGSIWFDDEYTVNLHIFGREWTRASETIGGTTIDKEVRKIGESQN